MATLSLADQQRVQRGLMRVAPVVFGATPAVLKADLLAAIQATDTWANSNEAAYNAALPDAFRNNATVAQKTLMMIAVIAMRAGAGWLRALLSVEVD